MRRAALLALAGLALSACAGLNPGLGGKGLVVGAPGAGADRADAVMAAERRAVSDCLELFISSSAHASAQKDIDRDILAMPRAYIRRYKVLPSTAAATAGVSALIATDRLRQDLDKLGLVRPAGVFGSPVVDIDLREPGDATFALGRVLKSRGYAVGGGGPSVSVTGQASAEPIKDERYDRVKPYLGRVSLLASSASGAKLAEFKVEATAVDLTTATAMAQALLDAGELAGERLADALAGRFRQRTILDLGVTGLSELAPLKSLVTALRGQPGVAGAFFSVLSSEQVRLAVYVEKLSPEDLALLLLHLPGLSLEIRAVDPDHSAVDAAFSPASPR